MDALRPWLPLAPALAVLVALFAIGVAVWLANRSWKHGTHLARVRLAYDICTMTIALLEQLESEVRSNWFSSPVPAYLGADAEARLAAFASGVIYRIELLDKHYHPTHITSAQKRRLRQLATMPTKKLALPTSTTRDLALHVLVTKMVITLLESNHAFVNQSVKAKRQQRSPT